jgi:hypothetical protein
VSIPNSKDRGRMFAHDELILLTRLGTKHDKLELFRMCARDEMIRLDSPGCSCRVETSDPSYVVMSTLWVL